MNRPNKINNILKHFSKALLIGALGIGALGCNSKKEDEPDETASIVYLPNVAVTSFTLQADKNVMARLDSVFFSIDLDHGVIFNADSLPVGAPVNKLVPKIKYSSYIKSAKIIMEGGTTRNDTVDYIKDPNDSIDFTGKVRLQIATANDEMKKEYIIKVNVHKEQPDSLVWGETALASLPSRMENPRNQKSVDINNKVVSMIEENDGSYTLSVSENLYGADWEKTPLSLSFTPDVRSLTASSDALYILDSTGNLLRSADGRAWSDTGEDWNRIIGGYNDTAIGLKTTSEGLVHAQYPLKGMDRKAISPDFPIEGYSNFVVHANKWTSSPVGFFCGGVMADGSYSDAIWAFDGSNWVTLAKGSFPALRGASLVPYYAFRRTSSTEMLPSELEVWMIVGGEMQNGDFNRTLYISYDNGVNWKRGSSSLQLPDVIPPMTQCDNIVMTTTQDTNLSDAWKIMAPKNGRKVKWNVDGDILSWECPYIYLIGGMDADHQLCNTIWRGVLNRLKFAPVI
ncbi:MAG: hypothetical protein K2N05_01660 [Muribaculaceae bacterium]|nr:hypothetical protein [Muribaculaceae bacterium]